MFRAAAVTRARKAELTAWQMLETGKNRPEADADVVEAIDYLEYYGREMLRLGEPVRLGEVPGEDNRYFYCPRGVALVIAPWNFPFAISMGMVTAALVAGNTVLYKPSSLSVVTGWQLVTVFREAGLPDGVLNFIPGRGELVGGWLAGHPGVDIIAFTGSRDVGLGLMERAARIAPGQRSGQAGDRGDGWEERHHRRCRRRSGPGGGRGPAVGIRLPGAEMFPPVRASSSLRAAMTVFSTDWRDAACRSRSVPGRPGLVFMGPLIDARACERVDDFIALGSREGWDRRPCRRACRGLLRSADGGLPICRKGPSCSGRRSSARCWQWSGPEFLAEALVIAGDTDYALTGGLFSRSPARIGPCRPVVRSGQPLH